MLSLSSEPPVEKIRVSVSQIRKYVRCQRAWWYEYGPLKIRPPTNKSAAVGTEVHGILEDYLINGTPPPDTKAGRIASAGLDKLRPGEELEIERSITLPLNDVANMLCRIDMLGKHEPYVGDHKTTGSFSWCKTRSEVLGDVQLLTYAFAGYSETKPPTVEVELIYYRREGLPVSMVVGGVVSWEDVEKNWHDLGEIAREMQPRKTDPTGDTCAGNSSACGDYGGCFHAPKCPFSPRNVAKLKKEFAQVRIPATNEVEINPEPEQDTMNDFFSSFGINPPEHPGPTVHTPEPAPDLLALICQGCGRDTPQPQGRCNVMCPALTEAPAAAPPATVKKRCDDAALKVYGAELAAEYPDGCTAGVFKERAAEMIAPSKLTDKRSQKLLSYSGVRIVSVREQIRLTEAGPFEPGYTEEPDAFETVEEPPAPVALKIWDTDREPETGGDHLGPGPEGSPAWRAARTKMFADMAAANAKAPPTSSDIDAPMIFETEKGPAIHMVDLISECTRHAEAISKGWATNAHAEIWEIGKIFDTRGEGAEPSAIAAPCVLLVGVQVNTQIATSIDEWLKPHIAAALALPDNYDASKGRALSWFEAMNNYKTGEQLLGHVLSQAMEDGPPAGLFYLSPRHPVAGVIQQCFATAGATIAIGQI